VLVLSTGRLVLVQENETVPAILNLVCQKLGAIADVLFGDESFW
jgi:hypothetical protein